MTDGQLPETTSGRSRRPLLRLAVAAAVIAAGVIVAWQFGLFERLRVDQESLAALDAWFRGFGIWAPIVFIAVWIVATVFFLPGLPITIVGALIFGPIWGSVYSLIGSTLGATAAFLVGRYAAREMVENLIRRNATLARIDEGVRRHGWRMLMITRLVPLFPFNAQNYVYGLTRIPLVTYVLVSLVCMAPATVAYNFLAGAVRSGNFGRFFLYLAIAAVLLVVLSLIPGWIRRRYGTDELIAES
ncbi:MAG: TVP38/TMEM64 family protein [Bacteroidetes bacterium]|nr:MAG: TVP38/TMEM64 family protein [Bacteroidota bacterium]